jgi:SH3-like domain-containing protein
MQPNRLEPDLRFLARALIALLAAIVPLAAVAQENTGPSGLALPRFVSTRSAPINVRVGPGTKYDIAWVFKLPGLPVEIIQEYDTWRKIRYVDGDEGWVHQNLLISRRTALVQPFGGSDRAALRTRAEDDAPLRAWLGTGFLISLDHCANGWCEVEAAADDDNPSVSGNILQIELWGVYPDEEID